MNLAKNSSIIVAGYGEKAPYTMDGNFRKIESKVSDCKIINGTLSNHVFCDTLSKKSACRVSKIKIIT